MEEFARVFEILLMVLEKVLDRLTICACKSSGFFDAYELPLKLPEEAEKAGDPTVVDPLTDGGRELALETLNTGFRGGGLGSLYGGDGGLCSGSSVCMANIDNGSNPTSPVTGAPFLLTELNPFILD